MLTDLIHEIGQTMATNKLRTALTGVAVTWGIFMLIVLLGMARGVTNNFEQMMSTTSPARLTLYGGRTSMPWRGNREGRSVDLKDQDLAVIQDRDAGVAAKVTGRISGSGKVSSVHANSGAGYDGVFPEEGRSHAIDEITDGRFINQGDLDRSAKVIVLSEYYANKLFPPDGKGAVGSRVTCNALSFMVVGVYKSRWNNTLYIPFSTAKMMKGDNPELDKITVDMRNITDEQTAEAAEAEVRQTIAAQHKFDPSDQNAVYIDNHYVNNIKANNALRILNTGVWTLGILTLLTGIVGVSNIMFVTVRERTHEIGIRRAIGARPLSIVTQVVAESVAITLVFGYIGIVLGTAATQVIAQYTGDFLSNPTVSLRIAAEVTAVLVVAGALAGLFPALRALKVKPVEALRDE